MGHLQQYIIEHDTRIEFLEFAGLFVLSWNLENIAGVLFNYKKWNHAFLNAPFILTNLPIQVLLGLCFLHTMRWTAIHHFGLLPYFHIDTHSIVLFIAGFMLLDLGEYIYHLVMHKVKMLWMFHMVHHSDRVVDISTSLREHPGENLIRLLFTLVWVFLSGVTIWVFIIRQLVQILSTSFAHMNYRLPEKIDSIVGLLLITPNLHQVHHHCKQPYTDSNYGDVLSIWDRLFGTLKKVPADQLQFGVDNLEEEEPADFISLVRIPFR